MKKVLFTTGLILASALSTGLSSLYAQTEQQVVVSEYKGKEQKTPLSGVSVTVLNAATSVSDQNGVAALRFRTMHPGDRVSVRRVVKNGYEIFNTQAVEQWNISPNHPFQLILCQSNQLHELRSQYSRVASDSYARQYKAEQARLASEKRKPTCWRRFTNRNYWTWRTNTNSSWKTWKTTSISLPASTSPS